MNRSELLTEYAKLRSDAYVDPYATLRSRAKSLLPSERAAYLAELDRVHALFESVAARWAWTPTPRAQEPVYRTTRRTNVEARNQLRFKREHEERLRREREGL